jgi:hypothetical protein
MQSAIDIVLRRFAEYHALEGAFGRRAITERAKGILMERHDIGEQAACNMLRDEARRSNRKLVDVAESVVSVRSLLPAEPRTPRDAPGWGHRPTSRRPLATSRLRLSTLVEPPKTGRSREPRDLAFPVP